MNLSFIVLIVFIIVACLLASRLTTKFGLPTLLIFMVLGMLFGVDGIFKLDFDNFELAEAVCSFALVFIMFYGGFGTNWKNAKPVAAKSFVLATIGVVLTAAITAVFCYFALGFDLLTSVLLGSVISSTDAASVFSVLKQKKLWLKENTTSLLALESGSNDPASYLLTVLSLTLLAGQNAASIGGLVAAQLCFALLFGVILAVGTVFVLQKTKFSVDGFDTILVLAAAVAAYAMPAMLGGNGYLSVYLFGLIVGNSKIKNKVTLVHFFDGVTGLAQMCIFPFGASRYAVKPSCRNSAVGGFVFVFDLCVASCGGVFASCAFEKAKPLIGKANGVGIVGGAQRRVFNRICRICRGRRRRHIAFRNCVLRLYNVGCRAGVEFSCRFQKVGNGGRSDRRS